VTRILDALRRHARRAWRWGTGRSKLLPVEAAVAWVLRQEVGGGLRAHEKDAAPCAATTRLAIPVLRSLGLDETADRWAAWLVTCPPLGTWGDRYDASPVERIIPEPADRLLARLLPRQAADGGFASRPSGCVIAGHWSEKGRSVLTALVFLDAALRQVRAAFEAHVDDFPDAIDPADGRYQAARRWLADLLARRPAGAVVVDAGCGKGRFARRLGAEFPQARLVGVDLAPAMLARLPPGVRCCAGSLLRLPLAATSVDGVLAVESLEHALLPQRAVDELCRIVRPGGRVLVIDKSRARQPLSHHDPWERWFTSAELQAWLGPWCDQISVEALSHLEGRPATNLFLAATGRRKE